MRGKALRTMNFHNSTRHNMIEETGRFRYIKIHPNTIDLSTRLWGISPTNSVVITQSLVLRSIVLNISKLVYKSKENSCNKSNTFFVPRIDNNYLRLFSFKLSKTFCPGKRINKITASQTRLKMQNMFKYLFLFSF